MAIRTDHSIHNVVTNGKTKIMIFTSLIFLFAISVLSMTFLFVGVYTATGIAAIWTVKATLGGLSVTSTSGIVYAIKSFFDTREAKQKHLDKLELKKIKYQYKLDRRKLREGEKNGANNK